MHRETTGQERQIMTGQLVKRKTKAKRKRLQTVRSGPGQARPEAEASPRGAQPTAEHGVREAVTGEGASASSHVPWTLSMESPSVPYSVATSVHAVFSTRQLYLEPGGCTQAGYVQVRG